MLVSPIFVLCMHSGRCDLSAGGSRAGEDSKRAVREGEEGGGFVTDSEDRREAPGGP